MFSAFNYKPIIIEKNSLTIALPFNDIPYMSINFNDSSILFNDNYKKAFYHFVIRSITVVLHSFLRKLCPNVSALCQLLPRIPRSCRGR